jgi:hypothetical protein
MVSIYQKEKNNYKIKGLDKKINKINENKEKTRNIILSNKLIEENIKINLNEIIEKDKENDKMIQELGKYIYQTFLKFNNNPKFSIIQNLMNFSNYNEKFLYENNIENINQEDLLNYYDNNYLIKFPYFKKFKSISFENYENINYIIKTEENNFIFYGTMRKKNNFFFLDENANFKVMCSEKENGGEVTAMLFLKIQYLIIAYFDNKNNNNQTKLCIYNFNNFKQELITKIPQTTKVTCLCECKENYFFSTSLSGSLICWMIYKDTVTCSKELKFNYAINYIIKFEENFLFTNGNKVKSLNSEIKCYYDTSIIHWNRITSLLKINIKGNNIFLLTSGNDFRVILWSYYDSSIDNINNFFNVSEIFLENQINCINKFNEKIFCCELVDNSLNFFIIDKLMKLQRIWYYNLYEYHIGKCFYIKKENNNKSQTFMIVKNNNEEIVGYSIFEEEDNNEENINEILFY